MKKVFFIIIIITREIEKVKALLASYSIGSSQHRSSTDTLKKKTRKRNWKALRMESAVPQSLYTIYRGLMAFINLFTNSGGHCMSEIRQMMTRKRQNHEILQYFMLFGDGAPSFSFLKGNLKIQKISEDFNTSNKCNP